MLSCDRKARDILPPKISRGGTKFPELTRQRKRGYFFGSWVFINDKNPMNKEEAFAVHEAIHNGDASVTIRGKKYPVINRGACRSVR
jgi:hypothetical protein